MEFDQLSQNSWLKSLNWMLEYRKHSNLDPNELINIAQETERLESFGPFFNQDIYEVYINDINESNTFHSFGRYAISKKILHHLIDSLKLQQLISKTELHNKLERVVLITGL